MIININGAILRFTFFLPAYIDFTEMMRVLGYPRLISLANFRMPNFPLVAEILVWLVKRFDPDIDIFSDHDTEEQRVTLIRSVAEFMVNDLNITSSHNISLMILFLKEYLNLSYLFYKLMKVFDKIILIIIYLFQNISLSIIQ